MNRIVVGAVSALLLASAGLFWWQGRAATEKGLPPPSLAVAPQGDEPLPFADANGMRGADLPEVNEVTREQRRFDRLDRDRDGRITANEMLAPRAAAFRKLDADHNNLLTFQEWSVKTATRFKGADANGDNSLTRPEFATTKAKPGKQPNCSCEPKKKGARPARSVQNAPVEPAIEDLERDDFGEPGT